MKEKVEKTEDLKNEIAGPSITGVRRIEQTHPSVGMTPSRLASLLRGAESEDPMAYLALAEDMEEKEAQYLSVLGTRKRAVSQLEITVEPGGDDAASQKHMEFIQEFINRDTLEDELFDILDSIGKGFSVSEIIWDISEKQWMPVDIKWRDPSYFQFDRADLSTLLLKTEDGPQPLQLYKFITHFAKAKSGIPIRSGVARCIAWCYLFKNFDIKSWVTFAEVYGQPIRLGRYHDAATKEDKAQLLRAVANIGTDAAAIIPKNMEIEFITSKSNSSADMFERLAKYMDQQISKIVLGQTTTTDAVSGGHAVSKEHNDVREDIQRADAVQLKATLNRQLIRPMIDLNFGPQKSYPKINIGRADEVDLNQLASVIPALVNVGLKVKTSEMYAKIGLEKPDDDDEILSGSPPSRSDAAKGNPPAIRETAKASQEPPAATAIALANAHHHQDDAIDQLADDMIDDWEVTLQSLLDPIKDLVARASSLDEIRDALIDQLDVMDDQALITLLARGGFNARLAALVGADAEEDGDAAAEA